MLPSVLSRESRPTIELTYRKLRPGESRLYRALRLDSLRRYPHNFGSTYEEESRVPRLMFESAIEEQRLDLFVVGALSEARLVGIAGFARREGSKRRHRGEITQVYVDPDQRGRSVGGTLVRALVEMAFDVREIEQVELSVVASNAAARQLYEKLGFETYGLLENYFRVGELRWHQCLMQLTRKRYFARVLESLP